MDGWKQVGNWLHGPNGERLRAISGAGGGGAGGGAGVAQGLGGMSNIDFTFGQGKVHEDKVNREMALLMKLIGSNQGHQVSGGQGPGPSQGRTWDPRQMMSFMQLFGGGR